MSAVPQWLARFGISLPGGTWEAHIARKSAGGVDFPAPVGTDMLAASDGRLTYFKLSDGSSVLRVTRKDGTATDLLHGHPVGATPRDVERFEHIGESDGRKGADGAGSSTGPHIHAHDIKDGKRVYPWSTVHDGGGGGGGGVPITEEGNIMELTRVIFDQGVNTAKGFASTAIITPITGFVQTSEGYGSRAALEAWTAIAGVLGFPITEAHVNADGWTLSQLFKPPAATVDTKAVTAAITAAVEGIDLPDDEPLSEDDIARIAVAVRRSLGESIVNDG